jgi:hypothetical protein
MRILRNAFLAVGLMALAGACGGGQKEAAEPAPETEPAATDPAEGTGEEGMGEEGAAEEGMGEEGGEGGEGGEW